MIGQIIFFYERQDMSNERHKMRYILHYHLKKECHIFFYEKGQFVFHKQPVLHNIL